MKKIKALVVGGLLAAVIARTGLILGLMRAVYVCTVADNGLSNCQTAESP
jgi:hypothetical protein